MDVRIGGGWRYIQKDADGNEFAFRGEYVVVDPAKRLVATFEFELMAGHIVTGHDQFETLPDGKTKVTVKSSFASPEALEGMLQSGRESDLSWLGIV